MTILSGPTIRNLQPVEPFIEATKIGGMSAGLSHCGYDVRIKDGVRLGSGEFRIASTLERFVMPKDVSAIVHDKSTWARRGLSVFNTVIEPGWEGYLTLELVNNSFQSLEIEAGSPIAQIVFHRLDAAVDGYDGKYQHQADRPIEAILEGLPAPDAVNHPTHYNSHPSGVEAITVCEHMGFNVGNAVKYLWRAGLKSPDAIEDLEKARWYCDREIERLRSAGAAA